MCNSRARWSPAVARRAHVIASANFLFQRRGSATGGAETSLSAIRWNIYGRLHVGLYTGERWTEGGERARARAHTERVRVYTGDDGDPDMYDHGRYNALPGFAFPWRNALMLEKSGSFFSACRLTVAGNCMLHTERAHKAPPMPIEISARLSVVTPMMFTDVDTERSADCWIVSIAAINFNFRMSTNGRIN